MQDVALGRGIVARARADSFYEIIAFVLVDMGENMKYAPYVLQAWVNGVYFYYTASAEWAEQYDHVKKFPSFIDAEVFVQEHFTADAARDSILVVPLSEVE
jgi:hypothetical protein